MLFSASYNEATCASIGGYYSQNDNGCFYNSTSSCSFWQEGQCYDRYDTSLSKAECDDANGYSYLYSRCYLSNYFCPDFSRSHRKCYFHKSASYDCRTCRLLDGFIDSGTCHYKSNCSHPLFLANNGQCYENQTNMRTAAECRSVSARAFHGEGMCYFSVSLCSSGYEVNCQCFAHKSSIYNAGSCGNFGGNYTGGECYYNSSHCPGYPINGQCYRQSAHCSLSTCQNIGGYYEYASASHLIGTCYYHDFSCSGFSVDGRHCYTHRANYSRATCRNIGGIYGYLYTGREYRGGNSSVSLFSSRTYHCLYETFNCAG